jgi:hypothetical protein
MNAQVLAAMLVFRTREALPRNEESQMYGFSRAIYRELAAEIIEDPSCGAGRQTNNERVLRACEAAMDRLATDRHYFAYPARTLFRDIRAFFPMRSQHHVWAVVEYYVELADDFVRQQPKNGLDVHGNPLQCRASTRRGTACQRMPLPHNGYCPSHQHLADTENFPAAIAA